MNVSSGTAESHGAAHRHAGAVVALGSDVLIGEIGRLTRGVHDAILAIEPEWRAESAALRSSARDSLDYVVELTERAAHRTMDLVERAVPIAETIARDIRGIRADNTGNGAASGIDARLENNALQVEQLQALLTDILMAQDYQDISGQIIRRVANLLREVEGKLVHLVRIAAESHALTGDRLDLPGAATPKSGIEAEGPIIHDGSRTDVAAGQDEVDDLLSKLGF